MKNSNKNHQLLFLFLFIIGLPSYCLAEPEIRTAVVDNESITITGQGFGIKPNPHPIRFDNFEGLTSGNKVSTETGWWNDSTTNANTNPMTVSLEHSFSGTKSAKAVQTWGQSNPQLFRNNIGFSDSKKIFISFWFRWKWPEWSNGTPYEAVQYKLWRVAASVEPNGNVIYPALNNFNWKDYSAYSWHPFNISYSTTSTLGSVLKNFPNNALADNNWYNMVLIVNQGSKGLSNGLFKGYLSNPGKPYSGVGDSNPIMVIDTNGEYLNSIKIDNYIDANNDKIVSSGATISNPGIYFDDIYIDNTLARVEIGDAPIYENCTRRMMQVPTSWSENSISVIFNSGNFSTSDQLYLYIVDSNDVVNKNGFSLVLSNDKIKPVIKAIK